MKCQSHHRIAPEGFPFIGINLVLVIIGWFIHPLVFFAFLVLLGFNLNFFRNPKRTIPLDVDAVISPADGTVIFAGEVDEPRILKRRMKRISVFMSPLNVHVNRIPVDGVVKQVVYNKGKYLAAFSEKASLDNEQNAVLMEDAKGNEILFNQIAGWLARRIVCYAKPGDRWKKGDIYGLIRYGSRVDVFVPLSFKIEVKLNDKTKSGETILAREG